MEPQHAAQALAHASSSLTTQHDVAGALHGLFADCALGLGIDAAGILVDATGRLELMASSSHQASELELHQLHVDEGPCLDAYTSGTSLQVNGRAPLLQRWPDFGRTMLDAGFHAVHAAPLVWHETPVGAMGIFRRSDAAFTAEEDVVAQAFADIATMLLIRLDDVSAEQLEQRIADALGSRVVIEQAKGVLADESGLTMAEAYDSLVVGASDHQQPLTAWASAVVRDAQHPPR